MYFDYPRLILRCNALCIRCAFLCTVCLLMKCFNSSWLMLFTQFTIFSKGCAFRLLISTLMTIPLLGSYPPLLLCSVSQVLLAALTLYTSIKDNLLVIIFIIFPQMSMKLFQWRNLFNMLKNSMTPSPSAESLRCVTVSVVFDVTHKQNSSLSFLYV